MRGSGRIYQRGPVWWIAYYRRGKEIRESARTTDRQKAERLLKHKRGELAAEQYGGKPFMGPAQRRITVGELLDALEADYRLQAKGNPRFHLKAVREGFGHRRAVDVSTGDVDCQIEQWLAEGYAPGTVNRRMQLLARAYRLAVRRGELASAPYIRRLSELGRERQGYVEHGDFEELVAALPEYLQDFTRMAYTCGWRKGALASLRWADVGQDVILLRAENSKNRKPQSIPLDKVLSSIIERRRSAALIPLSNNKAQLSEYVFHREGAPIGNIRKAWQLACVKTGLGELLCRNCGESVNPHTCPQCKTATQYRGLLFHDLRRSAVRNLIRAGVPERVAMEITGHKTRAVFDRYAIVNEAQKQEALRKTQDYVAATAKRKIVVLGR